MSNPQTPSLHFAALQKPVPAGQSSVVPQPEHAPLKQVTPWPQNVPSDKLFCDGVSPLQTPVEHEVPGGNFSGNATTLVPPVPSHCNCLQYPGSSYPDATVPSGAKSKPQTPDVQDRLWQKDS
jgi:hypothetical protein